MPTRILLVRHGATALSAEDRFSGRSDPPLSAEGEAQAAAMGRLLAAQPIAAAFASPLLRAARTAELVLGPHGLTDQAEPAFREIDHGRWEGLPQEEVLSRYGPEHARWSADPVNFAPEGGETGLSVLARAVPALRRVVEMQESRGGGQVLVVSHKATIRLMAAAVLGLDPRRYRDRLACELGSLSIISFDGFERARLELWNERPRDGV